MAKRARKPGKSDAKADRDRELLDQLKEIGAKVGLEVREEKLVREVGYTVHSGRCRVNGREVILLDRNAGISERTDALLESLAVCDLTEIYLEPEIRRLIRTESDELDESSDEAESAEAAEAGEQSSGA
jgi:hypothetical protein